MIMVVLKMKNWFIKPALQRNAPSALQNPTPQGMGAIRNLEACLSGKVKFFVWFKYQCLCPALFGAMCRTDVVATPTVPHQTNEVGPRSLSQWVAYF